MKRSIDFSKGTKESYETLTGQFLRDANVLDYGSGWGRLTRMMLQFIPASHVHACDADPKSVALFNSLGFETECIKVPITPSVLPFAPDSFDFIWLYSVLTHLPADAANAVMNSLLRVIKPGGLMFITTRPTNFWTDNPLVADKPNATSMIEEHKRKGFAHLAQSPHWGDTSMSIEYIERTWPQWSIVKTEGEELHQVGVYLARN